MQDANQATRIPNSLLIPYNRLSSTLALIFSLATVFLSTEVFIGFADWEDEEKGVGWTRNEGEEVWIVDAENVVEGERG